MQIKKMKDLGHSVYTPQVHERHSSLTMSPKQPNANKVTQPERQDAQAMLYPGTESEAATVTVATCIKCKNVHKVLLQDFLRGPGQSPKDETYVCFQCSLGVPPPPFHLMNGNPGVAHISSQAATIASPVGSKFKGRNYNPDKYYCDKCRFSTKDPLQYKKHMLQHEEIKFICSHCSHISYTKGAFQRHLVKHTGVFPYQCEYCEYGAIRNDYIIKHRKRVHEKDGDKRSPRTITKSELKRTSTSKQNSEPLRTSSVRATFHNRLSDQLSRFSLHASKGKAPNIALLPEAKESQKDVVCIPNKVTLCEPGDASLFENKNVEVEVLSPSKEPVQPGMPLTVVAPSELVVPANCLAQLLDVKVVNGTQQVVLKLFPLEENNCLEAGVGEAGSPELATREKVASEKGKNVASEQTPSSPVEDKGGKLAGLDPLQSSTHTQVRKAQWAKSCDFFSCETSRRQGDTFLHWEGVEGLQKRSRPHPHRTAPPAPGAFRAHAPPPAVKSSLLRGPGTASSLFPYKDAVSFPDDEWSSHRGPHPLLPLAKRPVAASFWGERGGAVSESDWESRNELSIPLKILSSIRKAGHSWPEAALGVSQLSSPHESECLHINLAGEDRLQGQPGEKPLEFKSPERNPNRFEGPVISSVFSLSSGSEDVPESIKWNNATSKIRSIELLRRKIAQLIESCGKPPSLTANSIHRRSAGPLAKAAPKATTESIHDTSVSVPDSGNAAGPLQKSWDGGTLGAQLHGEQDYPQFIESKKARVTAPVLIPKGAVLRVLNSSEDARIIEATCEAPVIRCDETQMLNRLPFLPVKQADLSLHGDSGPVDMSQNPETLPRPKPKRESSVCGSTPKKAPLHRPQGSSSRSKQGKLLSRSLAVSRRKTKQTNSSRKKSKLQADPSHYLRDPSIFQVARQLRLIAAKPDQLIKCPRRNQPVIVLNHPDVDSLEVTNVMKVINKYKGNVLKVVLSERTRCQLGIKRHQVRLTYQNSEQANQIKRQLMLKMKLKKVQRSNEQVVETLPDDSSQCVFKCWFCGRQYEDQEEWMSHGQRHLIEATRDWDVLSSKGK